MPRPRKTLEEAKKDMVGVKFNDLTVLEFSGKFTKRHERIWTCLCVCGTIKLLPTSQLTSGKQKSCGCRKYKHHSTYTRLYRIWWGIKQRCENKNKREFSQYGGKGIKLYQEWQDFGTFKKWALDNGYNDSLWIDRIDSNDNYAPENCRFVTVQQSNMNLPPRKGAASKYKGVYRGYKNKWVAAIMKDRVKYHIGSFDAEEDAARAYDEKALELFGEHAFLNANLWQENYK